MLFLDGRGYLAGFLGLSPDNYELLTGLLIYVIVIVLCSIFIWKFHKFIGKREVIEINLNKYNYSEHPGLEKTIAVLSFTIEYIIILPLLVLFWFSSFSIFIFIFSEALDMKTILMMSAAIIGSIRITSYLNQEISRDIAKVVPFTILAIFIIDSKKILDFGNLMSKISEVPSLISNIFLFLVFIFAIELLLRVVYSIFQIFKSFREEPKPVDEKKKKRIIQN